MVKSEDFKINVKLRIKSCVCNLVFDEIKRKEEDMKLQKERKKAAYEAWIDSIPSRYEYERTCRAGNSEDAEDDKVIQDDSATNKHSCDGDNFFDVLTKANQEKQFGEIDDVIEFSTDGEVWCENGMFSVIYDESVLLDTNCKTIINFDTENPQRISIYRTGNNDASLVFDADMRRIMCMYETFAGQISMCVITHNIINSILNLKENGEAKLVMDYTLEIGGTKTEYTHYEMTISTVGEQSVADIAPSISTVIKL